MISKNSLQVSAKEEKIRFRRQSLQLAEGLQSERLLRKYSDEDEEEDRSNLNTFNEKYVLLEMIGEGANARVHRCEYRESKKVYAVKIISMDEEHILELKKNFISIKQLRHPSIIKYHALYFDLKKSIAYLVMEHFPFPNLAQITFPDENVLPILSRSSELSSQSSSKSSATSTRGTSAIATLSRRTFSSTRKANA